MELAEKAVRRETVYEGAVVAVRRDRVILPDGREAGREVVEHPGGVAVLPLDEEGNVLLVRQWRHPFERVLLEIPAGKLERGEDPRQCALRELEEEVGVRPEELTALGSIYPSPGYSDEVLYLYLARGLRRGRLNPDEDEFLELCELPFGELLNLVMRDEVKDAKTVAAVLKAKVTLGL